MPAVPAVPRPLEDRVVLVTGTDRPLGAGIATALAGAGAAVGLVGGTDDGLCDRLAARGATVAPLPTGFGSRADVEGAFDGAAAALGPVDGVVHASFEPLALEPCSVVDADDDRFEAAWERTMWTTILCFQAAFPHFRRHDRGGRIVLVIPTIAMSGAPGFSLLAAATEGQRLLAKSAARQWGRHHITVNCVAVAGEQVVDGWRSEAVSLAPAALGGAGDPERDLGPAVVWFTSDASRFVTGSTVCVDGGVWMAP